MQGDALEFCFYIDSWTEFEEYTSTSDTPYFVDYLERHDYEAQADGWDQISPGWYVREVETGNIAYIPIETWLLDGQPLYGGRCVWIEKDKLFQILNQ